MVAELANTHGFWIWIILGLLLVGAEAMAPGIFLIWFGLAAILTGLADAWFGLSWQAALITFAGLSVAAVLLGFDVPVVLHPPIHGHGLAEHFQQPMRQLSEVVAMHE